MTYEAMIDELNESTQLDFYNYSIESIGINEASAIDAVKSFFGAIGKFLKMIKDKIKEFIDRIISFFKGKDVETKAESVKSNIKNTPNEEINNTFNKINNQIKKLNEKDGVIAYKSEGDTFLFYEIDSSSINELISNYKESISKANKRVDNLSKFAKKEDYDNSSYLRNYIDNLQNFLATKSNITKKEPVKLGSLTPNMIDIIVKNFDSAANYANIFRKLMEDFNKVIDKTQNSINKLNLEDCADEKTFSELKNSYETHIKNLKESVKISEKITKEFGIYRGNIVHMMDVLNKLTSLKGHGVYTSDDIKGKNNFDKMMSDPNAINVI